MLQIQDFKQDDKAVFIPLTARMKICREEDVLIGRYGASIGKVFRGKAGAYNVALVKTVPDETQIDRAFLFHLLKAPNFQTFVSTLASRAAQAGFNRSDLTRFHFLLPTLSEQKRIAAILDAAEALCEKRHQAVVKLDSLLESVFVETFCSKPSKSEFLPLARLAASTPNSIRTGPFGSQLLHSEFVDMGIAVLGIDNVVQNRFVWAKPRFITERKYDSLARYTVLPGDVLITIMGTCGRCAIAPQDIPRAINTKHICCITLDQKRCLPEYFHACFLNHPDIRYQLGVRERGAVMPGLNMQLIKELRVPLAPIDLQRQFVQFIQAQGREMDLLKLSNCKLQAVFVALQQRAFRGEL